MAVEINRWTGSSGSPTKTDITSINTRLNANDTHTTAGTTNPVRVPVSGTNYSYWASTRLFYDGSGTGTINAIKWYTDGSNTLGTGVGLQVATSGYYVQATGEVGVSGDPLDDHPSLDGSPTDAFDYTAEYPLDVAGDVTDPSSEDFGDFVVLQITVADTASAGATGQETITWQFDSTVSEA